MSFFLFSHCQNSSIFLFVFVFCSLKKSSSVHGWRKMLPWQNSVQNLPMLRSSRSDSDTADFPQER